MAVLTNKPVRPARAICEALGLAPYFLNIYGGNSFPTKKPDPEGLFALMQEADARPEQTVMIGDSQVDVQTARNAGAWCVGCTFGLAPGSLEAIPPDVLVDSPMDWTAALRPAKIDLQNSSAKTLRKRSTYSDFADISLFQRMLENWLPLATSHARTLVRESHASSVGIHTGHWMRPRSKRTFAGAPYRQRFAHLVVHSHSPWRFRIMRSFALRLLLAVSVSSARLRCHRLQTRPPRCSTRSRRPRRGSRSHRRHCSRRRGRPRRSQRRRRRHRLTPTVKATSSSPPHAGSYTLVVSEPGFETVRTPVIIAAPPLSRRAAARPPRFAAPVHIILPIAAVATNVRVNADNSEDLTAPEDNHDSSVMTSDDLKALPIFDNDYATAMSAFLDDNVTATGGTGLMVDGVEANRATVSASAVQEVRINQDPYSAQYYWPGRGQMEIITKSAADHYHGQFNFLFRDSALNAQNALAPSKPFEQRRIYEGHVTGPIPHAPKSSFLGSFNRAEEDLDSVVSATIAAHAGQPHRRLPGQRSRAHPRHRVQPPRRAPVRRPATPPTRNTATRTGPARTRALAGKRWPPPATTTEYREDDFVAHVDSTLSAVLLNQLSLVGEHDSSRNTNAAEAPRISVAGDFTGGSAQSDSLGTEYNFRLYDMVTWTRGRHMVKVGIGIPHIDRRAFDDNTNALGTYTFGPTLAADGVTVLQTGASELRRQPALRLLAEHRRRALHLSPAGDGRLHSGPVQGQRPLRHHARPSLRLAELPRHAPPRLLAARLLRLGARSRTPRPFVRGGGGIYYDRFGSGPLLDLARYADCPPPLRRALARSRHAARHRLRAHHRLRRPSPRSRPSLAQLAPNAKIPYQIQYGLSIERQLGEKATGVVSVYSARGIDEFRSVDINAPTPAVRLHRAAQSRLRPHPPDAAGGLLRGQRHGHLLPRPLQQILHRLRPLHLVPLRVQHRRHRLVSAKPVRSQRRVVQRQLRPPPSPRHVRHVQSEEHLQPRRRHLRQHRHALDRAHRHRRLRRRPVQHPPRRRRTATPRPPRRMWTSTCAGATTSPSRRDKDDDAPRLGFSAGAFNVLNHENPSSIDTGGDLHLNSAKSPPSIHPAASSWACGSSSNPHFTVHRLIIPNGAHLGARGIGASAVKDLR